MTTRRRVSFGPMRAYTPPAVLAELPSSSPSDLQEVEVSYRRTPYQAKRPLSRSYADVPNIRMKRPHQDERSWYRSEEESDTETDEPIYYKKPRKTPRSSKKKGGNVAEASDIEALDKFTALFKLFKGATPEQVAAIRQVLEKEGGAAGGDKVPVATDDTPELILPSQESYAHDEPDDLLEHGCVVELPLPPLTASGYRSLTTSKVRDRHSLR